MPQSRSSDRASQTAAARVAAIEAKRQRREREAESVVVAVEKLVQGLPPLPPELRQRLFVLLAEGDG